MERIGQVLARMQLRSIRGRIMVFAVLAALVPALITAVLSYVQNRRALTEKVTHELMTASAQAGREADVWVKERLYDLRVFASSYVVSENLARKSGIGRLEDYLKSVRARFGDYEELQLVDPQGRLVASSARGAKTIALPKGWERAVETMRTLVTEPYWDKSAGKLIVVLGVPVERSSGEWSGVLLARANFTGLAEALRVFGSRMTGRVSIVTRDGKPIVGSAGGRAGEREFVPESAKRLLDAEGRVATYRSLDGAETVGSARPLSRMAWIALAHMPAAEAYAQVTRLRNVTILVVSALLLVVGVVAYYLAALIVRPLDRLTSAAVQVSSGDLALELPAGGSGEVGDLTSVFNKMLVSLREHRAELERLSSTDGLTGLSNRRHLMSTLDGELERARRGKQPFSILMLDVDHFKAYNDAHGHQAGDEVLARLGAMLRESVRAYDCAARYGGEEFLVMLSATDRAAAASVADRIHERFRGERFAGGPVTVSIGVAEYPADGDRVDAVIAGADAALYEAKRAGRDRVVAAGARKPRKGKPPA